MAAVDAPALLGAGIRAAILAKVSRRAVKAVAAAVTGVLVAASASAAAPERNSRNSARNPGPRPRSPSPDGPATGAFPEALVAALRAARRAGLGYQFFTIAFPNQVHNSSATT